MLTSTVFGLTAAFSLSSAQVQKGFNYGNRLSNGGIKVQADFENEFNTAKNFAGNSGFTSARLFTTIQGGTTNDPIAAIPAAIATRTTLLLGLWASAGSTIIDNEIAALVRAINQYGTAFTDLIVGISVGSEDLYRISPTGIENGSDPGADPNVIVDYINRVRAAVANTAAKGKPVGHVDTWTAWVNGSNKAVIAASDFLGVDAYPYFQNTMANGIENGKALFHSAHDQTIAASGGKPVWVTETGWPVSGKTENLAVPSTANAKTYWDQVGCSLFGKVNTWWYILQDALPDTPNPSFGLIGSSNPNPLFDLGCPAVSISSLAVSSAT
ncbi:glycoside hydrolase family 17 protein, partial [Patellaria atrata CBS 101060]